MLRLIKAPVAKSASTLPIVRLRCDRTTLAKRIWRGVADDGVEFGFNLAAPLHPGDIVHQTNLSRYVVEQESEPVLEIALTVAPSAAAGIGWAVGNLHLELAAEATRLLTPDTPAARKLFERLKVPYHETTAVFRPGRFVRGAQETHELGTSHKH